MRPRINEKVSTARRGKSEEETSRKWREVNKVAITITRPAVLQEVEFDSKTHPQKWKNLRTRHRKRGKTMEISESIEKSTKINYEKKQKTRGEDMQLRFGYVTAWDMMLLGITKFHFRFPLLSRAVPNSYAQRRRSVGGGSSDATDGASSTTGKAASGAAGLRCIFRKCIFRKCIFRKCIFRKFCKFLAGSFSAVSKRNFARKYAFDSIFQALQDLHPFAPLQSQNFSKKSVWKRSNFREISAKKLQMSLVWVLESSISLLQSGLAQKVIRRAWQWTLPLVWPVLAQKVIRRACHWTLIEHILKLIEDWVTRTRERLALSVDHLSPGHGLWRMRRESMLRSGLPVEVGSFVLGKAGRASK